jgi:hypothetical protein
MVRPLISPKVYTTKQIELVVKSPNKHISTPLGSPRNRTVVIPAPETCFAFYLLQEMGLIYYKKIMVDSIPK